MTLSYVFDRLHTRAEKTLTCSINDHYKYLASNATSMINQHLSDTLWLLLLWASQDWYLLQGHCAALAAILSTPCMFSCVPQILTCQYHKSQNLYKYNLTSFSQLPFFTPITLFTPSPSLGLFLILNNTETAAFEPMRHKADLLWRGITIHLLIFKLSGLYLYTVHTVWSPER